MGIVVHFGLERTECYYLNKVKLNLTTQLKCWNKNYQAKQWSPSSSSPLPLRSLIFLNSKLRRNLYSTKQRDKHSLINCYCSVFRRVMKSFCESDTIRALGLVQQFFNLLLHRSKTVAERWGERGLFQYPPLCFSF